MIRILEFLWHGCWHRWSEPSGVKTHHHWDSSESYLYTTQISRCEKCKRGKRVKVSA